jgi:ribosomal protein S6--L-glutamate ligase
VRIVFINKTARPDNGSVFPDVIERLSAKGVDVEPIVPEERFFDLQALDTSADLYVLRSRSTVALNLAAALDVAGAPLLIPYGRERVLRNKFLLQQKLIRAGIPVPRSYVAWNSGMLRDLLDDRGPLVVKPHGGHGGVGVRIVREPSELEPLAELDGPLFVQEYKEHEGSDLKVYGIGAHVAAIRRIFPARTPEEKRGTPAEVSDEIRSIALRCDEALGLGLYGVDFIDTADGPVVIDINSTPGYKGIEGAAGLVADHIYERAGTKPAGEAAR